MLIAVNYHYVRPSYNLPYPGIHGITPAQFEAQLRGLAKVAQFVSGVDVCRAIRGEAELPRQALLVTFDDGLREQYEHALPVLRKLGVPAIFFVNTAPLAERRVTSVHKTHLLRANVAPVEFLERLLGRAAENGIEVNTQFDVALATEHYKYDSPDAARLKYLLNFVLDPQPRDALMEYLFADVFGDREAEISREMYMTREQMTELASEGAIGTHGHDHLPLGLLADADAEHQLDESIRLIADWTGVRPFALSYPYGSREASSATVARLAASKGIDFALTMERAANESLSGPLHLARFDNNDLPGGKAARWPLEQLYEAAAVRSWYLA
jgi:peptidoglycan/xylan/chitin deacetylase (PgdA/CDA1 family)